MTRYRVALLSIVALFVAGCGGGGGGGGGGNENAGKSNVKGSITMVAVWTGAEQDAFQAVINGFKDKYPDVTVKYKASKDPGTVISTAVEGGNPPALAALPQPGLMRDFQKRGAVKPIDFVKSTMQKNYASSWVDLGTIGGHLYGMVFKGANKSTVWYNVKAFKDAGVDPPKDWADLIKAGQTLKASGVNAYSIGGANGWTLTDLFENIYLRQAGPDKYDQLTTHAIPWTDPSVKKALTTMSQVLAPDNLIPNAIQTDFPGSVTAVFSSPPKAAMVFEGDFVAGVITAQTKAKAKTDYDQFAFPSVDGQGGDYVVGGGDTICMFKDTPAARAFVKYLATPQAAEIWAKRGGFSSPNKNVDSSVYPDDITRAMATALANASTFRFDMSDQAPAEFGADAEFTQFQNFLKNPKDVNGAAQRFESAAAKAYK